MIITWDDGFESSPDDQSWGYDLDAFINNVKIAIRERAELEHVWKVGATDGQHVPGKVRALLVGTEAVILASTGKANSFAFSTDTKKLYRCTADGANWSIIDIDHGSLSGLTDDDHTIYLLASGVRALAGDLSAGTKKITNLGAPTLDADGARKKYVDDTISGYKTTIDGVNASDSNVTSNPAFVDVVSLSKTVAINSTGDKIYIDAYIYFTAAADTNRIEAQLVRDTTVIALGRGSYAANGHTISLSAYLTGLSAGNYTIKMQIRSIDSANITYTYRSLTYLLTRG